MYFDYEVKIPDSRHGITRKTIRGITYIYYAYDHKYSSDKHYTIPKNTTIGKCLNVSSKTMYPNTNYLKYFPEAKLPEMNEKSDRSACLRIGAFIVIRKIIAEYHLDEIIGRLIRKDAGLFLDLAAYSIVTENNAGQYYPDYAYNHPLFTQGMRLYSDPKVSSFINSITRDQCIAFQNEWNNRHDHREKIYITYDSTNKNCQAGDLECVEIGHPKDDNGKPVLNYSIAYDHNNSEPLYYEEYPGSIVDVSQLQQMLVKARGYGYRQVGFILDRGYFSKENIHFMDKNGYEFIIMMKGMKSLVRDLVLSVKGSFEEKREYSLRDYKVNGITVKHQLYPSDEKERYFHIYYNERKQTSERENIEEKIDRMSLFLRDHQGMKMNLGNEFRKYFDLIFYHEGQDDEKFMYGRERYKAIDDEIALCGYFVITRENWKHTIAASPSIPRRRSVNPGARYTFLNCETRASFSIAESLHKATDHLRGNIRKNFYRKPICIPDTGHRCCCVMSGIRKKRYSFRTLPAWDREFDKSRGPGIWKQIQACFPDTFETVVIVCFCNTMLGAPGRHVHFPWTVLTVPYLLCPLHEADLLCYYAGL